MKKCIITVFLLVSVSVVFCSGSPVFAAKWYEYYQQAKDVARKEDWATAIRLFKKAIAEEPEPAKRKQTSGKRVIEYYPYLELGKAYLASGDRESAQHHCQQAKQKGVAPEPEISQCLTMAASRKFPIPFPTETPRPRKLSPTPIPIPTPRKQVVAAHPTETPRPRKPTPRPIPTPVPPTATPHPTLTPTRLRPTPRPTVTPQPPMPLPTETPRARKLIPTPTATPKPDTLPAITITSVLPLETNQQSITIEVTVTDDQGVSDVKLTIQLSGSKGLTIASLEGKPQRNQKRFQFSKNLPLKVGKNEITIEAVDSIGQIAKRMLSVIRKAPTVVAMKPVPLSEQEFLAQLKQIRGDVYAVIIGIGDYLNPKIPDLQFTENDAQGFYDLLTDPHYGAVPKDHVKLLLHKDATDRNIRKAIGTWLRRNAGKDDMVIIYYSGHGAPEGKETYWVTYDADIDDLFSTALSNEFIVDMLDRIQVKRMITFLDSCYSAATVNRTKQTKVVLTTIPWQRFSGEGRVTISASDGKQLSLELDHYQHGVFTYYLLQGLRGQADSNQDGIVEIDEIWNYVKYQVAETARKAGNPQNPALQGSYTAGIPLTINMPLIQQQQQLRIQKNKQQLLLELYQQGLIRAEQFDCAVKMLDSGKTNRFLEDLLAGKLNPETFSRFFKCDDEM